MSKIRIVKVPAGDVPLDIRKEWVGLEIPLDEAYEQPMTQETCGILELGDAPASRRVYTVLADAALDVLREYKPGTCQMWYYHVPGLIKEGRHLLFDANDCELIEG